MEKTPKSIFQNPNFGLYNESLNLDNEPKKIIQGDTGIIYLDASENVNQKYVETERRAIRAEAMAAKAIQKAEEARIESITDPLTKAYNRKRFMDFAQDEFNPDEDSIAIVMFDVDNLKKLNDTKGHPAGDALIKSVADSLGDLGFTESDFLVRWGGDEFLFVYKINKENPQFMEQIIDQIRAVKTEFENKFNEYAIEKKYNYKASLSYDFAVFNRNIDIEETSEDNPDEKPIPSLYKTVERADLQLCEGKERRKLMNKKEQYSKTYQLEDRPQLSAEQKEEQRRKHRNNFMFKK